MISILAHIGRLLITLVIGFILVVAIVVVGIPLILNALGYWVNPTATEMAEMAVEKNDVNECRRLISYGLFAPPTGEKRRVCIRNYAELTKDPSVCELLMPSSYGLSCVGGAQSEPDLCSMSNGEVRWKDGSESYESCANLTKERTKDGSACCLIARVAFVKSENDCSSLESYSEMHDECLHSLAFKNHDPAACDGIANANTKSACTVNAEAIRKNPSICKGCKVRVETLDQLK